MARQFPIPYILLQTNIISMMSYITCIVLATLSIFTLVMFLCASHTHTHTEEQKAENFRKSKLNISKKNLLASFNKANDISTKAFLKITSWRKKVRHEEDEQQEDYSDDVDECYEEAVWRKQIMKGGKCKPLEFSGKIEYDSEGNLLPDFHPSSIDHNDKIISVK